ncbi:histidine N-acetyltransferase-like [Haliotis asinina]|uniref:histidine N-acetyltransferase-like n=1 Tax=Haliotis asinina TaxID=109174 RepID=UPI0035324B13
MADYHIRRATVDDFDDVMAIGDVIRGIDYLRHCYHTFMDDCNVRSYVYIIGKEIVGFCCVHLIDDGMTFHLRGGRVKEGFRGQGIYSRLLKHVYADYKDVDSIKYDAVTISSRNFEAMKKTLEETYNVSCRKSILSYRFTSVETDFPSHRTAFLEEVNSSAMTALLEDAKSRDTLFPEVKIIIDRVALRPLPSNVKYILAVDTFALKSTCDHCKVSLLTVGTPMECQRGLRYLIDVFGSDVRVLHHHIIRHLEHLKASTQKEVVFQVCTSSDVAKGVDDIMKDLQISPIHELWTGIVCLEKVFPMKIR